MLKITSKIAEDGRRILNVKTEILVPVDEKYEYNSLVARKEKLTRKLEKYEEEILPLQRELEKITSILEIANG